MKLSTLVLDLLVFLCLSVYVCVYALIKLVQ